MPMTDYEKLGSFYLGRVVDPATGRRTDDLLLYDSKDLVTHAVCVGMTSSGKTGLCIDLLEEAAIDGVPALVIDPKGDMGNLMLAFPGLAPADFRPWINESGAAIKGVSPDEFARQEAEAWREGLARWGQPPERIRRLRDAAEVRIYTPGSNAGIPLSIAKSFACPPFEVADDPEALRERTTAVVSGLLGLAGIHPDPMRGREHILLSQIMASAWAAGEGLDLAEIIRRVQQPPFRRIGVMEVEGFFPAEDRFGLAMALNNLLASPRYDAWTRGEPMDAAGLLYTPEGKPRIAVVSVAHLGDAERMFFVSMLLNEVLAWVRTQSGTASLRAILYMDEVAGYFPPVANPPSKEPLLTLMKQSRAFGLGVVLATQNPVDIDYKGLSNAGTWFVGRLQTEQDKARLLDGLSGAMNAGGRAFDRAAIDRAISSLGKRVFLMSNVHEDGPVVFESRWAMSYLRGPLTRQQIKALMDGVKSDAESAGHGEEEVNARARPPAPPLSNSPRPDAQGARAAGETPALGQRPVLRPNVRQAFLPVRGVMPARVSYTPHLLGLATVHFTDRRAAVDTRERVALLAPLRDGLVAVDWDGAADAGVTPDDLGQEPATGAVFSPLPGEAAEAKNYAGWSERLADSLFRTRELRLLRSPSLGVLSRPHESERDFRVRLGQEAREERDAMAEKLRAKYAPKLRTLTDRVRRAEHAVESQRAQAAQAKVSTALSVGAAILGGFLGRKVVSSGNVGRLATAARGASRTMQESGDVARATENLEAVKKQLADLEAQFKADVDALAARVDPAAEVFEMVSVRPKKTDVRVDAVVLAWKPATA